MNKKALIGIVCIYFFIVGAIIFYFAFFVSKSDVELSFKTYGKDPYSWVYTIEDEKVVRCKAKKSVKKKAGITGGVTKNYYVFEGVKTGTTIIKFEHKNVVDNSVDETKVYKAIIDKDLKIKLRKQN